MIQRAYPTSREARLARLGQAMIADHQANLAALAEPFPSIVTLPHFVKRDLAAAIEAGRCTVTFTHPIWGDNVPRLTAIDVRQEASNYFVLVEATGREWVYRSALSTVAVEWHDFGDAWAKLSTPMRWALRYLAREAAVGQHKPRRNTLKALESRSHTVNGIITPSALALYRQHRQEFDDGNQ